MPKTAFLLDFASVISSKQMTGFKRVEQLLRLSRVIRNLRIFTQPRDTTGDTKKSIQSTTSNHFSCSLSSLGTLSPDVPRLAFCVDTLGRNPYFCSNARTDERMGPRVHRQDGKTRKKPFGAYRSIEHCSQNSYGRYSIARRGGRLFFY